MTKNEHNDNIVFKKLQPDAKTGYLPPGVHHASWRDIVIGLGGNSHRLRLIDGLLAACRNLAHAGCKTVYLDGSFVSAKQLPNDYDGAWETADVDVDLLDPVLLDFTNQRAAMKAKYLGELFPATFFAESGVLFRDFFRTDRDGVEKGIVLIDLETLP